MHVLTPSIPVKELFHFSQYIHSWLSLLLLPAIPFLPSLGSDWDVFTPEGKFVAPWFPCPVFVQIFVFREEDQHFLSTSKYITYNSLTDYTTVQSWTSFCSAHGGACIRKNRQEPLLRIWAMVPVLFIHLFI